MNPLAFCFLYFNFSIKSINILNLSLGQGMQNLTCHRGFFEFIPESPDVRDVGTRHSETISKGGPGEVQSGRLKMRQSFPIQSSGVEQVERHQPAGFWIGVPVRDGRQRSLSLEHRAGNACVWARVSGASCSCSHSEGVCSFCYLSAGGEKVNMEELRGAIMGEVLRL